MGNRLLLFCACLAGGGAVGWLWADSRGIEPGAIAGAVAWFGLESVRAWRALRWLRSAEPQLLPVIGGPWGEALQRVQRLLAGRDAALAQSQEQLQEFVAAIGSSPNGLMMLDMAGRIEWCNEAAASHFGLDPGRDLQQHLGHLVRDPQFQAWFQARDFHGELVMAGPRSTASRPVRLALQLHRYGAGRLLLLSRDVTAVEQADAMRRDFIANVSHEIRTPLTVLAGFVETLQTLELDADERARYLQLMGRQAQRMQTLVEDLLTLSRLEGSPLPGHGEWASARSLLAACEQDAQALVAALGKTLDLRFEPAPALELAGAAGELQSALVNLVGNAVRYTPSGGAVEVGWRALEGGGALFSVRDTGPGVAPEHLPRLTERFYRVDRSRSRETGGTGLGLAIVKHVAQRHGGELRIESTVGVGSTFAIWLPAQRVRQGQAGGADS